MRLLRMPSERARDGAGRFAGRLGAGVRGASEQRRDMEELCGREDYVSIGWFVNTLRDRGDAHPRLIGPPIHVESYQPRNCTYNAYDYALQNGGEPVKGFKLWKVRPPPNVSWSGRELIATAHVVVKFDDARGYVDVTPPEPGDEGKKLIFVPSSRLYPGVSGHDLGRMCVNQLAPRMGTVCTRFVHLAKLMTGENRALNVQSVDELELLCAPTRRALYKRGVRDRDAREAGGVFALTEGRLPLDVACVLPARALAPLLARIGLNHAGDDEREPSSEC